MTGADTLLPVGLPRANGCSVTIVLKNSKLPARRKTNLHDSVVT